MDRHHIDLFRITADIWAATLGLELRPNPVTDRHTGGETVVSAYVQITGDWAGAVMVQCTETLACRAAALMFAVEVGEVTAADVADALGELANMAGGNVKSLVCSGCQLSLPAVATGRDYEVSILRAEPIEQLVAESDGELVVTTLYRSSTTSPMARGATAGTAAPVTAGV